MKNRTMTAAAMAAIGLMGSAFSGHANACNVEELTANAASSAAFTRFVAGMQADRQVRLTATAGVLGADLEGRAPHAKITGLWKFAFTAPDGVSSIDWGFQTWHSDGTEITNSGGRPAKNGDFCMGVWKQLGTGSYSLNHWAIAWGLPPDFDENTLSGLVNIRETVDVDATGNAMSGIVSLDLYDTDGTTLLAHLVDGTVSGTRIVP